MVLKTNIILSVLLSFFIPMSVLAVAQINGQSGDAQGFQNDANIIINSSGNTHSLGWQGVLPVSRGGTGIGSFTAGSILFSNGTNFAEDSSNFFWDDINNRLGIGTAQPVSTLDVVGNASVSGNLEVGGNIIGNIVIPNLVPYTGATADVNLGTNNLTAAKLTSTNDASIHSLTAGMGGGSNDSNTAFGINALQNNTYVGNRNTAFGYGALAANTNNISNTAVGSYALNNSYGESNTAVGSQALRYNTSGSYNTVVGSDALSNNTTGSLNVALGPSVLSSNTSGQNNIGVGLYALSGNTMGNGNIAIGERAGASLVGGGSLTAPEISIYLGYRTRGYGDDNNSIVIGSEAESAGANKAVIGNSSLTDVYFGSSAGNANLHAANICAVSSGSSAPSSTPTALGQVYVDTVNAKVYISTGISSGADWALIN